MFHISIPTRAEAIVNLKNAGMLRATLCLGVLLLSNPTFTRAAYLEQYQGEVFFGKDQSKPAFLAERSIEIAENKSTRKMRFLDLQKIPLTSETLLLENSNLRSYTYEQLQMKEGGTVEIRDNKIVFQFKKQGKECHETEKWEPDTLAFDLFPDFLSKNWEELEKGQTKRARLLLIERCETLGIKFFKDKERRINGKEVVDFVMKPTNFFVNLVVPNTRITLEKASPHQLLEIEGRTTIRIPEVPNPKTRKDYYAIDARVRFEKMIVSP